MSLYRCLDLDTSISIPYCTCTAAYLKVPDFSSSMFIADLFFFSFSRVSRLNRKASSNIGAESSYSAIFSRDNEDSDRGFSFRCLLRGIGIFRYCGSRSVYSRRDRSCCCGRVRSDSHLIRHCDRPRYGHSPRKGASPPRNFRLLFFSRLYRSR